MAWNSPGQSRTAQDSTEEPKLCPKSPKVLQKGTQKSSKIVKKSHQNGALGQGKEIIPILLFGDRFLGSF